MVRIQENNLKKAGRTFIAKHSWLIEATRVPIRSRGVSSTDRARGPSRAGQGDPDRGALPGEGEEKIPITPGGGPEKKRPRAIKKALDYLDGHFDSPLTLEEVADINGMSKFHFSRVFKEKVGLSFSRYLTLLRINESKRLMREEEFNISEACFRVGFNSLSYFSRVFRQIEGVKPSEYIKGLDSERSNDPVGTEQS